MYMTYLNFGAQVRPIHQSSNANGFDNIDCQYIPTGPPFLSAISPLAETTLQTSSKPGILHWEGWTEPLDLHQPILSYPNTA